MSVAKGKREQDHIQRTAEREGTVEGTVVLRCTSSAFYSRSGAVRGIRVLAS
jgi:hypothetical protein